MDCEKKDCVYQPMNVNCVNCGAKHWNYKPELARQVPDDVQAAIGWIESEKSHWTRDFEKSDIEWKTESGTREMHEEHIAALDLAISALRQMQKEPWIPVSERLPETQKAVAIWEPLYKNIYTAYWTGDEWRYFGGIGMVCGEITHWMLLPAPPLGGDRAPEKQPICRARQLEPCEWCAVWVNKHNKQTAELLEHYDVSMLGVRVYRFCPDCGRPLGGDRT